MTYLGTAIKHNIYKRAHTEQIKQHKHDHNATTLGCMFL